MGVGASVYPLSSPTHTQINSCCCFKSPIEYVTYFKRSPGVAAIYPMKTLQGFVPALHTITATQ